MPQTVVWFPLPLTHPALQCFKLLLGMLVRQRQLHEYSSALLS